MAMSVSWSVRYFGSRLKYLIKAYSLATWPSSQAKKTKTKVGIQISSGNPDVSAVIKAHWHTWLCSFVGKFVYLPILFWWSGGNTYQQGNGLLHNTGARHCVNAHLLCLLRQWGFFPQLFHFSGHYLGTLTVENSVSSCFGCPWQTRFLYAVVQPSHFQDGF